MTKSSENQVPTVQVVNIGLKNQKILNMLYASDCEIIDVNGDVRCSHGDLNQKIPACDMAVLLVDTSDMVNLEAAVVVGELSKERGTITIGFFTKKDMQSAGIDTLCARLDSYIIVRSKTEIEDELLGQAMESLICFIGETKNTEMIHLEFTDVSSILKNAGLAYMGMSKAVGRQKAEIATKEILSNLLQKASIGGAQKALVYITGSMDIELEEVGTVATLVQQAVHSDASLVFGAAFDERLEDEIRISVIITGFEADH